MIVAGNLNKMRVEHSDPIRYALPIGQELVDLNPLLGESISITYSGNIHCQNCGRLTRKSFNQGYCFPCSQKLARCDLCIMRPERCHYRKGTCREPEWGEKNCMRPHVVYLANSSGLKVGITRENQLPTRWIDQGAAQALPVFQVESRYHSGMVETTLAKHVNDKTNWRTMLKGDPTPLDLQAERDRLLALCAAPLVGLGKRLGAEFDINPEPAEVRDFRYPVMVFPLKVSALNLDKTPAVSGRLLGMKGQYLILDSGVLNVRKYTGYCVDVVC